MKTKLSCRCAVALLLAGLTGSLPLWAAAPSPAPSPVPAPAPLPTGALLLAQAELDRHIFIGDGLAFLGSTEVGGGRVVKGAPYCADAEHETVQWLADGNGGAPNRITKQTRTRQCRDGEGRTRQELERNGRTLVYLNDPQAGESWVLDPERKTARRLADGRPETLDTAAWRDYAERMREWGRELADRTKARLSGSGAAGRTSAVAPVPPVPPAPPTPVFIHAEEGGPVGERRVEVEIKRMPQAAEAPAAPLPPPAVQWRSQVLAPRGAGSVTPLPARDIEGVRANGERTTWTIDAGKVGNDKPIQITREVWTSPELMVTLQSRDFDPRSGEVNYRLKSLRRGEPGAALMQVPADYGRTGAHKPRVVTPKG